VRRGFSLIELIIAIIILAILLTIAVPKFKTWKRKEEVKQDIQTLYSIIQSSRNKAFLTKKNFTMTVNGTEVQINGKKVYKLNTPFYSERGEPVIIHITARGTFGNQTSIKCFDCDNLNLPYDCIKVTWYNLRISRCD